MKALKDCRVTVIGLGLMGASLCMDLVQKNLCREVRGVARRSRTVLDAFFAGAVDQATTDLQTGVAGADIVILATPVRTIMDQLRTIGPMLWPGTLVMDMGSTKSQICAVMEALPAGLQPIGAHPMTGKEVAGFEAAEPDLYRQATWVLSPLGRTAPDALQLATELVEAVGARPLLLPPQTHDRLVAAVSHLPYLLAGSLTHRVAEMGAADPVIWDIAAGGFRDTSRVAASDTRMFLDILLTNRGAVLEQVEHFIGHLQELQSLLEAGDEPALGKALEQARHARAGWKKYA